MAHNSERKTSPLPKNPDVEADWGEKGRRLEALIDEAERINKRHPVISVKKAMLLLNPLPRRAYSLEETAQILGISYNSVYRLVQKRKLKIVDVLRHKLVALAEIDRFLGEQTMAEENEPRFPLTIKKGASVVKIYRYRSPEGYVHYKVAHYHQGKRLMESHSKLEDALTRAEQIGDGANPAADAGHILIECRQIK